MTTPYHGRILVVRLTCGHCREIKTFSHKVNRRRREALVKLRYECQPCGKVSKGVKELMEIKTV